MLTGTWRSLGYGWLLDIGERDFRLHHVSRGGSVLGEEGSRADFARCFDRVHLRDQQTLSLYQAGDLTRYDFQRVSRGPRADSVRPGAVADAVASFDTLWHTFNEHYAFFARTGTNWEATRRRQRARVTASMPAEELAQVFTEMLLPLDDGHVSVAAGSRCIQARRFPELRDAFERALGAPHGRVSPRASIDAVARAFGEGALAPSRAGWPALQTACNDILHWCALTPAIGYISVLRLFGFADAPAARRADDLPHGRAAAAEFLAQDIAALDVALDRILADLQDCRAIVIDLRINGGGFDRAAVAIASRFADRAGLAFSKCARSGEATTERQDIFLQPGRGRPFLRPVYVMTSPLCVSAGEVLVLALRALPQVTVVGQPTHGMLSDNLNKLLPNGWAYSLSNEIYTSHDGRCFEGVGIPPDVHMTVIDADRFLPAMQSGLNATVALAAGERTG